MQTQTLQFDNVIFAEYAVENVTKHCRCDEWLGNA